AARRCCDPLPARLRSSPAGAPAAPLRGILVSMEKLKLSPSCYDAILKQKFLTDEGKRELELFAQEKIDAERRKMADEIIGVAEGSTPGELLAIAKSWC